MYILLIIFKFKKDFSNTLKNFSLNKIAKKYVKNYLFKKMEN